MAERPPYRHKVIQIAMRIYIVTDLPTSMMLMPRCFARDVLMHPGLDPAALHAHGGLAISLNCLEALYYICHTLACVVSTAGMAVYKNAKCNIHGNNRIACKQQHKWLMIKVSSCHP